MTRFVKMCIGAILLALVFTIGIASAVDGEGMHAELNISKEVSGTGPFAADDEVTWVVTLWNNGPDNATNITVEEDLSGLTGLQDFSAVASLGDYNTTTNLWSITELENATSATLTLTTNFSTSGTKENKVNITALDQYEDDVTDNSDEATVEIQEEEIIPPLGPTADLNISKTVTSSGPYDLEDEVTWVVTLWNNGPDNATNITVEEDLSGLAGLQDFSGVTSLGDYNTTTNLWNITELENATSASLTLTTNFSTYGSKVNKVNIIALDQIDTVLTDNSDETNVLINAAAPVIDDTPLSVNLSIKPTTLNLNSKGIFTVYVTLRGTTSESLSDEARKPRIDFESSSLTCGEAELVRASVSNKGGGTLIAKFHRYDLENVTTGNGVQINCSGTLSVNGETITVEGSDTIRVIGEKKGLDKILSGLWKFLGIEKDEVEINQSEDGYVNVTLSLNPDDFKNPAQLKKTIRTQERITATIQGNSSADSDEAPEVKEKGNPSKNNGNSNQLKVNNANAKSQKGNISANARDDEPAGKSNGKNK